MTEKKSLVDHLSEEHARAEESPFRRLLFWMMIVLILVFLLRVIL